MNEEKICPIMSRPAQTHITVSPFDPSIEYYAGTLLEVICIGERCAAWGECIRKTVNPYNEPTYEFWTGCRFIK